MTHESALWHEIGLDRYDHYNYEACRNLVAEMLHQAVKDAAYGQLADRLEAERWLKGDVSRHWAMALGIEETWPPSPKVLDQIRLEHYQRYYPERLK
jgi:hypothetical protein